MKLRQLKLGQSVVISDMVKNPNPEGLKEWVTEEHARRWQSEQGKVELNKYADISSEALDKAYGYGISKPGTFGYTANQKSAEYAIDVIEQGETDIEKISDAIHQGWSEAAKTIDDPIYTTKPAKKEARLKLANTSYADLSEEEKEKDRVVARALLQKYQEA